MTQRSRPVGRTRRRPSGTTRGRTFLVLTAAAVGALAIAAVVFVLVRPGGTSAEAWSRLGTEDVHSLAFVGEDSNHLLFGHHGGILSSTDGGRSWQPLGTRSDAMSLGPAADGSIVIAGHEVFAESRDEGRTWQDIPATLPSLDIHGFARDPGSPARMWAYLATGGLWESVDAGRAWERVQEANILFPVAAAAPSGTRLFGLTAEGLASSDDGGRTWGNVATPELYPIVSLAATSDGSVLVAGGPDGLARSDDGGASWSKLPFEGQPFAIAVSDGGRTIALVTRATDFFRSDDGGRTWPGP
ncbi:MAG: sialidase family protein [Candidatus Limnocylindrales bacterium]|nr:sialidase family protein [Candidatus Limnocylindrales bacterium]